MSKIYETRLRKEFELLQRLNRHPNVKNIIKIFYKERISGGEYKSVSENPSDSLYPNCFKVTYTMPMYVGEGQLKKDWSASFLFDTPEEILMDSESSLGVEIEGNGGNFPTGTVPFNNHVSPGWVCTGTAWGVANQGFGIWYFVISLGCLFNQEKFMMACEDEDEHRHLNSDAFRFWKYERNMQPNNQIDWPFKLLDEPTFGSVQQEEPKKPSFGFGVKTNEVVESKKPTFGFGQKKMEPIKKSTFSFGSKTVE